VCLLPDRVRCRSVHDPYRMDFEMKRIMEIEMFGGSIVALVTPFRDGVVDHEALKSLVDWHVECGTDGIVPVGTTGESPTLSSEEHKAVVETVVKAAADRVPVVAGTGSNSTEEAIDYTQHAEQAGVDAALIVVPYYNRPTQEGLKAHFIEIHDCTDLPIIIYNIPGRSAVDMSVDTMASLARLPRIVGVKDATGDLTRVSDQREACGSEFVQLSGEDETALGFNAHGGVGCISVTANVAPVACKAFQACCANGDYEGALAWQDRLMPLHRALFLEASPAPVKYGLSLLERCLPHVRFPLVPPGEDTCGAVEHALRHAGALN